MSTISSALSVRKVPSGEYDALKIVVCTWKKTVEEKVAACRDLKLNGPIFENSLFILNRIENTLNSRSIAKVVLCEDRESSCEAIGVYLKEKDLIELSSLATNPKNIKHQLNDLTQRVSGAPTCIIKQLALHYLKDSCSLLVDSLKCSRPFYDLQGFEGVVRDDGKEFLILKVETIRTRFLVA